MWMRAALGLLGLIGALAASGVAHGALPARLADGEPLPTLAPMLDRVSPAVVNIATYTNVRVRNPLLEDPFFRRFFNVPEGQRYRRTQSAGSGVVVDPERGYILTNNHVVAGADEITVTLASGDAQSASLVGSDPQVDLAVLKVEGGNLTAVEFGDSEALRVGDFVVAIGNPFGLNQTVTSGIVSALGRSGLGIEGFEDFIQTDASINPGNSGGALVDLAGRLIGINTAIFAPAGGNVGIGFAIPVNMARAVMDHLIEHGEVRRGYVGIEVQSLTPDLARAFGIERTDGVVISDVAPESPAEDAGLRAGDVVVAIDGRAIRRVADYHSQTAVTFAGAEIEVEVLRDGRGRTVRVPVGDGLEMVRGARLDPRFGGAELQNFRDSQSDAVGEGVLVTSVESDSRAWRDGLRSGDLIVGVNRREVRNLTDLRDSIGANARQILLRVYRNGQFGYVALR
jgi:serine protease Do/serine protease DegQ